MQRSSLAHPAWPAAGATLLAFALAARPEVVVEACGGAAASCGALVRLDPRSLALPWPLPWMGVLGAGAWAVGLVVSTRSRVTRAVGAAVCGAELYLLGVMTLVHGTACPLCLVFAALLFCAFALMLRAGGRAAFVVAGALAVGLGLAVLHPEAPPLRTGDRALVGRFEGSVDADVVYELFVVDGCPFCAASLRELRGAVRSGADLCLLVRDTTIPGSLDAERAAVTGVYAYPTTLVHVGGTLVARYVGRVVAGSFLDDHRPARSGAD